MLKFFFGMVVLAVIEWIWLSLKGNNNSGSNAISGTSSAECEAKLKSLRDRVSDRDAQIGHLQARVSVMEKDADRSRQKKPAVSKKVTAKTKSVAKATVSKKTTTKKPSTTTKKIGAAKSKALSANKAAVKKASTKKRPDDLKKVSGIGPKIAQLMKADGITDFASLAVAKADKLDAILKTAGPRFSMADASTWPKQASLLDKGDLAALKKLQKTLKKGK